MTKARKWIWQSHKITNIWLVAEGSCKEKCHGILWIFQAFEWTVSRNIRKQDRYEAQAKIEKYWGLHYNVSTPLTKHWVHNLSC